MELKELQAMEAYELIRNEELPDIHAQGILMKHKKSGARVILVPCKDENKVFCIGFRTPPADSTGVAHIIEHTVLCGSEKYPLKDPFVELVKGSLNTFLNAMTYPDKTIYPVASTNQKDFRNLMNVYLDAVFFPNIYHEQNIFRQEGWHYELEDKDAPLTVNGVVYNEMKGVFSSADDVLERETMNALFPDTAYGVESGGDPEVIPELTYEDYLEFHSRYYHPSNSYIYLYGDLDFADTLSFLDREYLSRFDVLKIDSSLRFQEPFEEGRVVVKEYPVSSEEDTKKNTFLSWNVVAGDALNMKELIAMEVLDYALLSSPGAPVKQALLDAGIGLDVYGGFSDGTLQPYFSVTAKNAEEEDAGRFEKVIRDTLKDQVRQGINRKSLTAGIHSMEFSFREADYGLYPKGLFYCLDVLGTWLYSDEHPFDGLKQLSIFAELLEEVENGYFERMVEKKLLGNPHKALVILRPKAGLTEEREQKLASKLAARKAEMSEEELEEVIATEAALRAWQDQEESQEALDSLPVLKRSDLKREILPFSNIREDVPVTLRDGETALLPAVYHIADCNGIAYLDLIFNAKRIPGELLPYLGILKAVLMNVGTRSYSYQELNNEVNSVTGGISIALGTSEDAGARDGFSAQLSIRMKALIPELVRGAELIHEILYTSCFEDEKRLREIISQTRSQMQIQLQTAGHAAAAGRASAYLSGEGAFNDAVLGIAFYRVILDIEEHFDEKAVELQDALKRLCEALFRADNAIASYTCEEENKGTLGGILSASLEKPKENVPLCEELEVQPLGIRKEGFITPGQVQYVAMAGSYADSGIPYSGALTVCRQILSLEYLWQNVRVRGGAYGCSVNILRNGRGVFASFRDPHLLRTKEVFEGAPEYLAGFAADEKAMSKYIIGTISGIDTPLTPSTFGLVCMKAYLSGRSEEERQRYRLEVIDATQEEIRSSAAVVKAILEKGALCVIGGESSIRRHEELFGSVETLL